MASNKASGLPDDLVDVTPNVELPDDLEDVDVEALTNGDDATATPQTAAPIAKKSAERIFYVRDAKGGLQPVSYENALRANSMGLKVLSEAEARALLSSLQQTTEPEPPTVGPGETFLNRAVNAVPLGHTATDVLSTGAVQAAKALGLGDAGARLTPSAQAELAAMGEDVAEANANSLPNALNTYRQMRDIRNARTAVGSEENPWAGRLGAATGIGLSMLAPLPKALPKGGGLTQQAIAGAKTGAAYGALTGLTEGSADLTRGEVLEALGDTVMGGALGAGVGAALPIALQGGWKSRALTGGALGSGYGAIDAATEKDATPGDIAMGALKGGTIGAAGGVALPMAVTGANRLLRGAVQPTPAAKYLRSKGVPLTTGQMNPESALAQFEEVGTSVGGIGPSIQAQRTAARQGWQDVVLNEARPPGMPPGDSRLPISERLTQMAKGFDDAYAPAKGIQVEPRAPSGLLLVNPPPPKAATPAAAAEAASPAAATPGGTVSMRPPAPDSSKLPLARDAKGRFLPRAQQPAAAGAPAAPTEPPAPPPPPTAFDEAVGDPSILATESDRGVVRKFLDNQLSLLDKQMMGGRVDSKVLIEMRSNIRAKAAEALKAEEFRQAQLLENAEDVLTGVLDKQLPSNALSALRAADVQYSKYKPVEATVARSGDAPDGFTPVQLSGALRSDMEKGAFARGGGGELRKLAATGQQVLNARVPTTGARLLTTGLSGQYVTAPMSFLANRPGVQRFLLGETPLQRSVTSIEDALANVLRRNPVEAQVRALTPVGSEEERRQLLQQQAFADYLRRSAEGAQ